MTLGLYSTEVATFELSLGVKCCASLYSSCVPLKSLVLTVRTSKCKSVFRVGCVLVALGGFVFYWWCGFALGPLGRFCT